MTNAFAIERSARTALAGFARPDTQAGTALGPATRTTGDEDAFVSIVMRTKERPLLLRRAITSVVAQTWPFWQLIVINDAGDPGAVEAAVAAETKGFEAQVNVIHRTTSEGMETATNEGIAAATGRYVTLLDDDDTWDPKFLEVCVTHLRAGCSPRVRGVVTHFMRVVERVQDATIDELERVPFASLSEVSLAQLTQHNLFPVNSFVYERSALDIVGRYRSDLPVLGDWEFNLRFVRHFDIDVIPKPLANYHVRPQSGDGAYANSPSDLHVAYATKLRNELLRADLDAGVLGLGLLANLSSLLANRELDALVRARYEGELQLQIETHLAEQSRAFHEPLIREMVARMRKRRAAATVIVGAGQMAALVASQLSAAGIRMVAIGDNDVNKSGTMWQGLFVSSVAEALAAEADSIVIASLAHRRPMRAQVLRLLQERGLVRRVFTAVP